MTQPPIEYVRQYASRGFRVFPGYWLSPPGVCACGNQCNTPGKHPLIREWQHRATTDLVQLEAWWQQWPEAHVCLATGKELVVLDFDPQRGGDKYDFGLAHGGLPDTPTVHTGGGGEHAWFTGQAGVRNSVDLLAIGVDVRGEGGYVVAPPSGHVSGNSYLWDAVNDLDVSLPPLPDWVIALMQAQTSQHSTHPEGRDIPQGERHDALVKLGMHLRRQGVARHLAHDFTRAWNQEQCHPPQPEREVTLQVDHIYDNYMVDPVLRIQPIHTTMVDDAMQLSDVQIKSYTWLWEPYIARGKFLLIDGDPGVGKSMLLMRILAHLSTGTSFPFTNVVQQSLSPAKVVIMCAEDALDDTIAPRAQAAGADLTRLWGITVYKTVADLDWWQTRIFEALQPDVLLLDPLFTFLPADTSKSEAIRVLQPFLSLAEEHDCALLATRHVTKQKQTRTIAAGQGSMSIAGLARLMWLITEDEEDPSIKIVEPCKASLTSLPDPFTFTIENRPHPTFPHLSMGVAAWGETRNRQDVQAQKAGSIQEAKVFLSEALAGGPRIITEIKQDAQTLGISHGTLGRAKKALGIRRCPSNKSLWELPPPWELGI